MTRYFVPRTRRAPQIYQSYRIFKWYLRWGALSIWNTALTACSHGARCGQHLNQVRCKGTKLGANVPDAANAASPVVTPLRSGHRRLLREAHVGVCGHLSMGPASS